MRNLLLGSPRGYVVVFNELVLPSTLFECRFSLFEVCRVVPAADYMCEQKVVWFQAASKDVLRPDDRNKQDERSYDAN